MTTDRVAKLRRQVDIIVLCWCRNIPPHDRIASLRGSIIDYSYGSGSSRNPAVLLIMDRYKCDLYAAIERHMNRLARYDAVMFTFAACIIYAMQNLA